MKTHFERIQEEVNFLRDQRIDNIVNTKFGTHALINKDALKDKEPKGDVLPTTESEE